MLYIPYKPWFLGGVWERISWWFQKFSIILGRLDLIHQYVSWYFWNSLKPCTRPRLRLAETRWFQGHDQTDGCAGYWTILEPLFGDDFEITDSKKWRVEEQRTSAIRGSGTSCLTDMQINTQSSFSHPKSTLEFHEFSRLSFEDAALFVIAREHTFETGLELRDWSAWLSRNWGYNQLYCTWISWEQGGQSLKCSLKYVMLRSCFASFPSFFCWAVKHPNLQKILAIPKVWRCDFEKWPSVWSPNPGTFFKSGTLRRAVLCGALVQETTGRTYVSLSCRV